MKSIFFHTAFMYALAAMISFAVAVLIKTVERFLRPMLRVENRPTERSAEQTGPHP